MADQGIKKAIVPNSDLPIISTVFDGYAVRYRIISDDKNRTSCWSPIYHIPANYTYVFSSNQPNVSKNGNSVSVIWDKVEVKKGTTSLGKIRDYEVWVRWGKNDTGDWYHDGKAQTNSASFIIPQTYYVNDVDQQQAPNQISIEIYLEGIPVVRNTATLNRYVVNNHAV
jgi:hypothetical protein